MDDRDVNTLPGLAPSLPLSGDIPGEIEDEVEESFDQVWDQTRKRIAEYLWEHPEDRLRVAWLMYKMSWKWRIKSWAYEAGNFFRRFKK